MSVLYIRFLALEIAAITGHFISYAIGLARIFRSAESHFRVSARRLVYLTLFLKYIRIKCPPGNIERLRTWRRIRWFFGRKRLTLVGPESPDRARLRQVSNKPDRFMRNMVGLVRPQEIIRPPSMHFPDAH